MRRGELVGLLSALPDLEVRMGDWSERDQRPHPVEVVNVVEIEVEVTDEKGYIVGVAKRKVIVLDAKHWE